MADHRQHLHQGAPAFGGGAQKRGDGVEALGRSVGGVSTKLHIATDAPGNPVGFIRTPGQDADVTQAEPLIRAHQAGAYILDKAYDSDAVIEEAQRRGGIAIIPPKKNRRVQRRYDRHLYKERVKVEWLISLLKPYRRVATRSP